MTSTTSSVAGARENVQGQNPTQEVDGPDESNAFEHQLNVAQEDVEEEAQAWLTSVREHQLRVKETINYQALCTSLSRDISKRSLADAVQQGGSERMGASLRYPLAASTTGSLLRHSHTIRRAAQSARVNDVRSAWHDTKPEFTGRRYHSQREAGHKSDDRTRFAPHAAAAALHRASRIKLKLGANVNATASHEHSIHLPGEEHLPDSVIQQSKHATVRLATHHANDRQFSMVPMQHVQAQHGAGMHQAPVATSAGFTQAYTISPGAPAVEPHAVPHTQQQASPFTSPRDASHPHSRLAKRSILEDQNQGPAMNDAQDQYQVCTPSDALHCEGLQHDHEAHQLIAAALQHGDHTCESQVNDDDHTKYDDGMSQHQSEHVQNFHQAAGGGNLAHHLLGKGLPSTILEGSEGSSILGTPRCASTCGTDHTSPDPFRGAVHIAAAVSSEHTQLTPISEQCATSPFSHAKPAALPASLETINLSLVNTGASPSTQVVDAPSQQASTSDSAASRLARGPGFSLQSSLPKPCTSVTSQVSDATTSVHSVSHEAGQAQQAKSSRRVNFIANTSRKSSRVLRTLNRNASSKRVKKPFALGVGLKLHVDSMMDQGVWDSKGVWTKEDEQEEAESSIVPAGLQEILPQDVTKVRELGRGCFGSVWLAHWNGVEVALKELHHASLKDGMHQEVFAEAERLAGLRHPCVIAFYGIVTASPDCYATVVEYICHGSLRNGLHMLARKGPVSPRIKAAIALQAARGMEYLHFQGVVHFDLKADNLLCDLRDLEKPVVKIADLGLSRLKEGEEGVKGALMLGTLPWMAPELLPGGQAHPGPGKTAALITRARTLTRQMTGRQRPAHLPPLELDAPEPQGGVDGRDDGDLSTGPPVSTMAYSPGTMHSRAAAVMLPWMCDGQADDGHEPSPPTSQQTTATVAQQRLVQAPQHGATSRRYTTLRASKDDLTAYDDDQQLPVPDLATDLVTDKVDVYSFGITMWEIWTLGQRPYSDIPGSHLFAAVMNGNLRPDIPDDCDPHWASLMKACWAADPASRPTFTQVAQRLQAMIQLYEACEQPRDETGLSQRPTCNKCDGTHDDHQLLQANEGVSSLPCGHQLQPPKEQPQQQQHTHTLTVLPAIMVPVDVDVQPSAALPATPGATVEGFVPFSPLTAHSTASLGSSALVDSMSSIGSRQQSKPYTGLSGLLGNGSTDSAGRAAHAAVSRLNTTPAIQLDRVKVHIQDRVRSLNNAPTSPRAYEQSRSTLIPGDPSYLGKIDNDSDQSMQQTRNGQVPYLLNGTTHRELHVKPVSPVHYTQRPTSTFSVATSAAGADTPSQRSSADTYKPSYLESPKLTNFFSPSKAGSTTDRSTNDDRMGSGARATHSVGGGSSGRHSDVNICMIANPGDHLPDDMLATQGWAATPVVPATTSGIAELNGSRSHTPNTANGKATSTIKSAFDNVRLFLNWDSSKG